MTSPKLLAKTKRQPPLPYIVSWANTPDSLQVVQWLRVLPGKRYVGRGLHKGREVLVKLFIGSGAFRKARQEVQGHRELQQAGVTTPKLLFHGVANDQDGAWVVTEFIASTVTLSEPVGVTPDNSAVPVENRDHHLDKVVGCIAQMHLKGIIQRDIHPGNFLLDDQRCWVIDTADIAVANDPREQLNNFALFLAQLPTEEWPLCWQKYRLITAVPEGYDTALALARICQASRAEELASKSLRDCSLFSVQTSWNRFTAIWRQEEEALSPVLSDLDQSLRHSEILKNGGTATVGLLTYRDRPVVIKRYNLKNQMHRLKRFWRPTRAWHSWRAGHRLRALGIATPCPLAMVEERFGCFRGRGYLIADVASGSDLFAACHNATDVELNRIVESVRQVLLAMADHKISHGDFKATNLFWKEELQLIDLDAICWHKSRHKWLKAYRKDQQRLLRNWSEGSRTYLQFEQMIKSVNSQIKI